MPYIDSDFLKKKIFPYGMADNGNYGINAKSVMVAIENAPEIDAVEVVRCKDCKHWETDKDYSQTAWCTLWTLDSTLLHTKSTDFCSYGERKCQSDT